MGKRESKKERITALVILLVLLIISLLIWDTYFIYPIKLCVVLLHEMSHALATIISGGKIIEMKIGFDLGGKCETEGGNNILIASAGYLGSLIWGLIIFLAPNSKKYGKWIIITVALLIILAAGLLADGTFVILALILSSLLISSAFYMRIPIVSIMIRSFGMISCVYVLFDIKEDLLSRTAELSDAALLAAITDIPVTVIGLSWAVISILGIYFAVRLSYKS